MNKMLYSSPAIVWRCRPECYTESADVTIPQTPYTIPTLYPYTLYQPILP